MTTDGKETPMESTKDAERLRRWRLVLGEEAQDCQAPPG